MYAFGKFSFYAIDIIISIIIHAHMQTRDNLQGIQDKCNQKSEDTKRDDRLVTHDLRESLQCMQPSFDKINIKWSGVSTRSTVLY